MDIIATDNKDETATIAVTVAVINECRTAGRAAVRSQRVIGLRHEPAGVVVCSIRRQSRPSVQRGG